MLHRQLKFLHPPAAPFTASPDASAGLAGGPGTKRRAASLPNTIRNVAGSQSSFSRITCLHTPREVQNFAFSSGQQTSYDPRKKRQQLAATQRLGWHQCIRQLCCIGECCTWVTSMALNAPVRNVSLPLPLCTTDVQRTYQRISDSNERSIANDLQIELRRHQEELPVPEPKSSKPPGVQRLPHNRCQCNKALTRNSRLSKLEIPALQMSCKSPSETQRRGIPVFSVWSQ